MTKTDVQMCLMLAQHVGIILVDNGDGSVTYGNTVTRDADRCYSDLKSEERNKHREVKRS